MGVVCRTLKNPPIFEASGAGTTLNELKARGLLP